MQAKPTKPFITKPKKPRITVLIDKQTKSLCGTYKQWYQQVLIQEQQHAQMQKIIG